MEIGYAIDAEIQAKMNDLVPGDLVEVLHPGFSVPPLAVIIELNSGTHLYNVLMMNDESRGKIFRYSSSILRKVS
jgi:hypothetical protein